MKAIDMDLNERQHCSHILNAFQGPPLDITILAKIFDKVKLDRTDEMVIGLNIQGGTATWSLPSDLPTESIELEDEEVRRLKQLLIDWKGYSIRDAAWHNALIKKLA